MLITAHGGALNTGRNTMKYFDTIKEYQVDAIEVDVMGRCDVLYLGHILPAINLKKTIKLDFVFDYCRQYNFMVNCDLKQKGLLKKVVNLAKKMNAGEHIYFTGSVTEDDIPFLTEGTAFVNNSFYKKKCALGINSLDQIKSYLNSLGNTRILGINFPYAHANAGFLMKADEIDLGLSVYTVDNENELERIMRSGCKALKNVTTNLADKALIIKESLMLV